MTREIGPELVAGIRLFVTIAAVLTLAALWRPQATLPPVDRARVCSGCGTRWTTINPERYPWPDKPITQCPNCPMSDEEFESLKEQVRQRQRKGTP